MDALFSNLDSVTRKSFKNEKAPRSDLCECASAASVVCQVWCSPGVTAILGSLAVAAARVATFHKT